MNTQILAILISEGSKLVSEYLRSRPFSIKASQQASPPAMTVTLDAPAALNPPKTEVVVSPASPPANKATAVPTGCVPCSLGHFGTCSGLLNEAMRFANKDGVDSPEVIDRVNMCLDELNAMERVDLRPEMITNLPEWEKELALQALNASRQTRHGLESMKSTDDLEQTAAVTQSTRTAIGRGWFKEKLNRLSPEDRAEIQRRVEKKLSASEELAQIGPGPTCPTCEAAKEINEAAGGS